MTRALDRKVWRDLWASRWTSCCIALLVAVVTVLVAGGSRTAAMFEHTRSAWYRDLALADLDIRCSPARPEALDGLAQIAGIADAEPRLVIRGMLEGAHRRTPAWVQVLRDRMPRLNRLHVLEGRAPPLDAPGAIVDRSLVASHGIAVGDRITIQLGDQVIDVPVLASGLSPEHLMLPVHPEYALPLPGTVALIAVTPASVQHLPRIERFNSLLITLDRGAEPDTVADRVAAALPIAVDDVVTRTRQPTHQFTEMVHRTFAIYWPAVSLVMVLIAVVLMALTLERLVERQRSALGVLRALGHGRRRLVAGVLPLALLPTAVGFATGALLHGHVARGLFEGYARSVGLPPLRDPGPTIVWAVGIVSMAAAALTAVVVCMRLTRAGPATLLRPPNWVPPSRAAWPIRLVTRMREALRLPVSIAMGWTNVVRRRVASVAAIAGLGAAFALILAFLVVHVTHRREVEASVERLGLDATVQFARPVGVDTWERVARTAQGDVEPLVTRQALVAASGRPVFRRVVCARPGRWIAKKKVTEGRRFETADAREVLVDRWVANQQSIRVGDELWIHAYANSPDALQVEVVGIVQGVSLGLVILPLETGQALFDLPGLATAAHVQSSLPAARLEADLAKVPTVQAVFSLERARAQVHRNFAGSTRVLTLCLLLAIVVAIVFLGILAALDVADHAGDLALLRALGWRDGALLRLCLTEVGTRGIIALLGALPVAPLLARWIVDRISEANHYRMAVHHPGWLYAAVIGAVLLLLPLGALPAWRVARRLSPGRAMRVLAQ